MPRRHPSFLVACVPMTAALTGPAAAQWSPDPLMNLGIAVAPGDQVQAKIAPTSDGGAYISWFGNPGGGYDVWLQRLNAAGVPQWTAATTLIADRSFSSTQDYGLDVDASDHALLSFRDDRLGGIQITATRVSPAGAQVWGPTGVQVTSTTDFVASPRIAALGDGRIAVGWTHANTTRVDVLDSSGRSVLKSPIVLSDSPGTANLSLSDLRASDQPGRSSGNFVVLWVRQQGAIGARQLRTRAYDSSGSTAWDHGPLFASGSIQQGNFPTFVSDGAGGAVFSWYLVSPLQCFAQWVDATGEARWAVNGLPLSTNATRLRVSPSIAFNTRTQEAFAFWTELNSSQSMQGLYGQRIDATGARLWGDEGLEIIGLGATPITQVRSLIFDNRESGAAAFFVEDLAFGNQRIRGSKFNAAGDHQWPPGLIDVCGVASSKSRLFAARGAQGFAILAWSDGRNDSGDIYAQNVNADGSLGPACAPADLNCDTVVNGLDLGILLINWSIPPGNPGCGGAKSCPSDLNGDGQVNGLDLGILLGSWTI